MTRFPTIERPRDRVLWSGAVFVLLALWMLPLAGVALTSLRPAADLAQGNYWGWPSALAPHNYVAVLAGSHMGRFIVNSVLITLPAAAGAVALSTLAGFALAKHEFPGNRWLLSLFVAGNLVPFQTLMIPVRDLTLALGLYDTRRALVLFHVAFQTGFCTLFMRNFIRELPDALLETARLEGASEWRVLTQVVLPLVRPALAAVGVLVFTFVWNDYFWALVLVQSDEVRPLTAGVQSLRGMWHTSWELVSAASILAAIPPVAVFFALQRQLVQGLTFGARRAAGAPS